MPASSFLLNPKLPVIQPNWAGNRLVGKQFVNADDQLYAPKFSKLLKWQLSRNPQRDEKKRDHWTPVVQPLTGPLLTGTTPAAQDALVWWGHATFLLQWGGLRLLFDPVFFNVSIVKRRTTLPADPAALQNLDYVLFSHGHRDHLDTKSVQAVAAANPQAKLLVPLRMAPLLRDMAPNLPVQEAGWWQQFDLGPDAPLEIFYLPAQHWHRRGAFDLNEVLWGSFLIRHRASGRTLYFAGDTAWGPHFRQIADHFGPLDWVLLPIGAYKPPYMMYESHISPAEAVKAFNELRGEVLVPMHHGTFDLSDEPASEPLRTIERVSTSGGVGPGQRLATPAIGETLVVSG